MCGICAIYNVPDAARRSAIGLHAQQHRAIDFAGIVSTDGIYPYAIFRSGVVRKAFGNDEFEQLLGRSSVGHIRYPTLDDDPKRVNIQPLIGYYCGKMFAVAHNGNITNTEELSARYKRSTSLDTEFIVRMMEERTSGSFEKDLAEVLVQIRGSYALAILLPDRLIAVNDPQQNRPLSIARIGDGYCVSSETASFPILEARFVSHVEAGTIVTMSQSGIQTTRFAQPNLKRCVFERMYFSSPSSEPYGADTTDFRLRLGEALERSCPTPGADYVMEVPDSARLQALGYAERRTSGRHMPGIIRSHYAGRTFIAATQALRDDEIAAKFTFTERVIRGKRIVLVDDSIVRGSTMVKVIKMLRWLGAASIHVRVACPVLKHHCNYGIYTKGKDGRLIANEKTVEDIRIFIGADTLEYISLDVLKEVLQESGWCFACIDGERWDLN